MAKLSEQAGLPNLASVNSEVARRILRTGEVELLGRMPWSSNATFIVVVRGAAGELLAIYKPRIGERPLWDFEEGSLCKREVAAAQVAELLGWPLVPDTVLRDDLPHGVGSLQVFLDHDPDEHYFNLLSDHTDVFRRFGVFDVVVNNTDRKSGHLLRAATGSIFGIDHGVCFHEHWKLRTVIWEFGGEQLPVALLSDLECLSGRLRNDDHGLGDLISPAEMAAMIVRVDDLLANKHFPIGQNDHRHYPWPLV